MTTADLILDEGKENELTVYDIGIEELKTKEMAVLLMPSTTSNYLKNGGSGKPKVPKILDLMRIRTTFNVDGYISSSDLTKFRNLMMNGGTFSFKLTSYSSTGYDYNPGTNNTIDVNMEKFSVKDDPSAISRDAGNPTYFPVKFSVVEGIDLGS